MQVCLVVDTNFLIYNLDVVDDLRALGPLFTPLQHQLVIVIPYKVVEELDGLKNSEKKCSNGRCLGTLARTAISWTKKMFGNLDPYVVAQTLIQVNEVNLRGDDAILDCCKYFKGSGAYTVLLSNDNNLCAKVLGFGIKTVSYENGLTAQIIAETIATDVASQLQGVQTQYSQHQYHLQHINQPQHLQYPRQGSPSPAGQDLDDAMDIEMDGGCEESSTSTMESPAASVSNGASSSSCAASPSVVSLPQLGKAIQARLLTNIIEDMDERMREEFDDEQLKYFRYHKSLPEQGTKPIRYLIKQYASAVFTEIPKFLRQDVMPNSDSCPSENFHTKKDILRFIEVWGGIWIHVTKRPVVEATRELEDMKQQVKSTSVTA